MSTVQIDKVEFSGWPNCYRIANGEVDLVVTGDIGPRVMRYGFAGGQNFFKEFKEQLGKSGESCWQPRGGHRLWMAPEDRVKSYAPDNGPIHIRIERATLTATEPVEALTGLEKQMEIRMAPAGTEVEIIHRIRNAASTPCEVAPWALTMMAQGGTGIHGLPPRGRHPDVLDASNPLVLWAYTDLSDSRWKFLRKYILLRQDASQSAGQKIGSFNPLTWGAYLLDSEVFIKRSAATPPVADYPDFGCSFEMFTNAEFLELETLGPIRRLQPGEQLEHRERWSAHRPIVLGRMDDDELDRLIAPAIG